MSSPKNNSPHEMKKSKFLFIRILWITLGSIFVAIGTIGIFVPGLPTIYNFPKEEEKVSSFLWFLILY